MAKALKTLSDLKPDPDNPRSMEAVSAAGLSASLDRFGNVAGITWNRRTGELVSGHQRVRLLVDAGAKLETSRDRAWLKVGEHEFDIRVVDWSRARQRAANVAANSRALAGEFTPSLNDMLASIRGELKQEDFEALRFDVLAGEYDIAPLDGLPELDVGEGKLAQVTFTLSLEQHAEVMRAVELVKAKLTFDNPDNKNANGNAAAAIFEYFLEQCDAVEHDVE